MNTENNPQTDPKEGQSAEGTGSVNSAGSSAPSQDLILGKFKTTEDLIKAYQEAEKKITEISSDNSRKYKEEWDRIARLASFESADELLRAVKREIEMEDNEGYKREDLGQLNKFETEIFLLKHKEAQPVLAELKSLAKAEGISLEEAWNKSEILREAAKRASENQGTKYVNTNQRISGSSTRLREKFAEVKRNPTSERAKEELVGEFLREAGLRK